VRETRTHECPPSDARRRGYMFYYSLFQHYFGGLDHCGDGIAHFKFHLFGAAFGDYAFDQILSDADDYVSHHSAEFDFGYRALQAIARR
jgi:hypothetical protein